MEHRSDATGPKGRPPTTSKPRRRIPLILVATIIFAAFSPTLSSAGGEASQDAESEWEVKVIQPEVVSIVPHDSTAFTQGLEIHDGKFYESTGLYGESSVRIVNMSTGEIEVQHNLSDEYFGEGLTIWNDSVIQLTWRENTGFIYALETLEPISNFTYSGEGWGICSDDGDYWMSDGGLTIKRLSEDFSTVEAELQVLVEGLASDRWNELECAEGIIAANRWYDDSIYLIDHHHQGRVCEKFDFTAIREQFETEDSGVLNGIAYDEDSETWWVTGKNWSNYYEVIIDFNTDFDDNCERVPSENCEDNSTRCGVSYFTASDGFISHLPFYLLLVVALFYVRNMTRAKRQTEKPPRLSEDE